MARDERARVAAVESNEHADRLHRLRHSSAHIMAQAVRERFQREGGNVSLGVGPATADGFYYDFLLPRTLSDDDLGWIEQRMREVIAAGYPFEMHELSAEEARRRFADEPFKLELIDGIQAGNVDDNGEPLPPDQATALTVYQHDDFVDLCRGPHVDQTSDVDPRALKLLGVAGAYWRGDEHRPMLQRIYGTAWATPEDLEQFLWRREEAERRDHRKLGRELELFHLDPTAPGMPYWLPKGLKILNALLDFWRRDHEERGYQEISSPLVNDKSLWETSGHWDHYKDNMFIIPVDEHTTYALKPMNCPNAHVVYNLKIRSYRDLPLRLSDCDILHRYERSGTLHGLLRVRRMQQDDAHIFVTPDQIGDEYARIFDICDQYYSIFGLRYELRLGTRPDNHIGDVETWDRAEATLKSILDDRVGPGRYTIEEGDGAFYGPKIDILMYDALGRQWQMGTIQLDMQLPGRFDCTYTDSDGHKKTPVVIHRVIYGSLERFLGILIEHTAGAFPLWISPVQVKAIPVRLEQSAYAEAVAATLRSSGFRVEVDHEDTALSAKIRRAQLEKVPIMLVLGQREVDQELVSPRLRTGQNLGAMPLEKLSELLRHTVDSKAFDLEDLVRAATSGS
jgi:threonyl-tRNA synthetase